MKKITLFLLFLNLVFGQDKILNNWFKEYNTSGTFVFYDGKTWASNDFSRAMETFSPASTFKIFNALIALDSGVIKTKKEIFYHYRGEKVFLSSWAQDMNLNIKVLDKVYASENSAPFTLYFNFDKPIGVFILFLLLPALFTNKNYVKASLLKWILLILSPLFLLSIPWYFNVLKFEFSLPWWLPYFLFSNVLLVALVEENDEQKIAWIVGFVYLKDENKYKAFALNLDIDKFEDLYKREKILEKYLDELVKKVKNDG